MSVQIKMQFPPLAQRLQSQKRNMLVFLAAQMQTNRGLLFQAEGGRNGNKRWKPPLLRKGMALSDTGTLRKSLAPGTGYAGPGGVVRMSGTHVEIGTTIAYAPIVNFGGTFTAPPGRPFKIPLPSGKNATDYAKAMRKAIVADNRLRKKNGLKPRPTDFIFRMKITIPERRFDIMTAQDQKEISRAYEAKLRQVMAK